MSDIFFNELRIPKPKYNLGIGSGTQSEQTGKMLIEIERVLENECPDRVLVYGDTNSTLAGALAATKLHIPVAHVEAGLRSYDRSMPEEINRVLTDQISDLLFCPTKTAVNNLAKEGIVRGVYLTGDVMVDALEYNRGIADKESQIIDKLKLKDQSYLVLTVHRPSNTDNFENVTTILDSIERAGELTIFPVHPRTRKFLLEYGLGDAMPRNVIATKPLGYLDMIQLMSHAKKILTDSGGIQKEAYILGIPCVTLRKNTEWIETLEGDWNVLAGVDPDKIVQGIHSPAPQSARLKIFGNFACKKIVEILTGSEH
jgi:UDP-N-acetylglucosamine 2-epimerase (non-hydrolysing)